MRNIIFGGIISLIFVIIFLGSDIGNLNKPLRDDADLFSSYFIVENNLYKLSNLDFNHLFDTRMYFPRQNTLAYGESLLSQSLLALPIYIITKNPLFSANVMIITTMFVSFLAMFLLAYYFTKNIPSSSIAGLIFTYNPYVYSHYPYHFNLISLEWIPLILLLSEKLIQKVTWPRNLLLTTLLLLSLMSSFYYFSYLVILWPLYIFYRIYSEKIYLKKFMHPSVLISIFLFSIISYFYIQPYIKVREINNYSRSVKYNMYHSAQLSDFIYPIKQNLGGVMDGERSVFMGFTVYFLIFLSLFFLFKNRFSFKDKPIVVAFFLIFLLAVIFSMGPYLQLGNLKIPSVYLALYKLVPFFNGMRVPVRFISFAFLSAAVISAFALFHLKGGKKGKLVIGLIAIVLILEYWHSPASPYIIQPEIVKFYSYLNSQSQIRSIIELPIANGFKGNSGIGRDFSQDCRYLLYALYHQKYLVNASGSSAPDNAYDFGNLMTINFPTTQKLNRLKKIGVDLIVVHIEEYKDKKMAQNLIHNLEKSALKKVYTSENISAFKIE